MPKKIFCTAIVFFSFASLWLSNSFAGVFDLPGFLEPGQFSLGLEPEIAVSNDVGLAGNLKPRLGINDLINAELIVGTGLGDRRFRVGGILDLEWFPDVGRQPGIATPLTLQYLNIQDAGEIQLFTTPLVYKAFSGGDTVSYTPFLGVPLGWAARDGILRGFTQIAIGTMIRTAATDRFRFVVEAGFNIHHSYSYISGGVVFYFTPLKPLPGAKDESNSQAPTRVVPPPKT